MSHSSEDADVVRRFLTSAISKLFFPRLRGAIIRLRDDLWATQHEVERKKEKLLWIRTFNEKLSEVLGDALRP